MFSSVKKFFGGGKPEMQAAAQPAPPEEPKVRSRDQVAVSSYLKSAKSNSTSVLATTDRRLLQTDLTSIRNAADTKTAIRDFVAASPDLSSAVFSYIRLGVTRNYTALAKNLDGTHSPEGTALLHQLLVRFDILTDYSTGFSGTSSMRSNSESLAKELLMEGACSLELVLGKDRLPRRIQPVSVKHIKFKPDGKQLKPVQIISGVETDLDIPTFFYCALDQDLLDPYASSPLEPALKPVLSSEDFQNDIRRIVKRVIHPRLEVKIDEVKFLAALPQQVKADEAKVAAARGQVVADIESKLANLEPEDALVYFDTIGVELLNNGNASLSEEYKVLGGMIDSKMATGAKAMPSVLGHGTQSANIASTETMLFTKSVEGVVTLKLNEIYSRTLTLALRLFGLDVYAEFKYDSVDLRPESELEAFKSTKQSRLLEQLSLGLISDDEASIALTGHLPPAGYVKLSGTMFKSAKASTPDDTTSNSGSTLNQKQASDQSSQPRGGNKKADPQKANP
jgi:hypothetical protein